MIGVNTKKSFPPCLCICAFYRNTMPSKRRWRTSPRAGPSDPHGQGGTCPVPWWHSSRQTWSRTYKGLVQPLRLSWWTTATPLGSRAVLTWTAICPALHASPRPIPRAWAAHQRRSPGQLAACSGRRRSRPRIRRHGSASP